MSCITITEESVIIHCGNFIKHDGYTHKINALFYILHRLENVIVDRKIEFHLTDGEPLRVSAFDSVIEAVQQRFNLSRDRLIIRPTDPCPPYVTDKATVIPFSSWHWKRVLQYLDGRERSVDPDACLFGSILGRFTPQRLVIAYALETQLRLPSFLIFQPDYNFVEFEMEPYTEFFTQELDWLKHRREVNRNIQPDYDYGGTKFIEGDKYMELWPKFQIEVTVENTVEHHGWFTEKTTRCLRSGKPFILYGTQGQMQCIRDMGFQTWAGIWDESYDLEVDSQRRLDMIVTELKRIANLEQHQLDQLLLKANEIAQYNRKIYDECNRLYYQRFNESPSLS